MCGAASQTNQYNTYSTVAMGFMVNNRSLALALSWLSAINTWLPCS